MEEVLGFVVALLLGALIGLQREYAQQRLKVKNFAGIRTFTLISLLGAILGYFSGNFNSVWVILGFIFIGLISLVAYFVIYKNSKKVSGTTEVSFVLTYVVGVLTTTGHLEIAVIFGILIAALLTFKEKLHGIAKHINGKEIVAIIEFVLIAFVVLPLLPNVDYSPADVPGLANIFNAVGVSTDVLVQLNVFNLYTIWWMVILIAGMNLAGYFLVRFFGSKKGYGLVGFLGGLVSSTAVTVSMAEDSKKRKFVNPLVVGTVLASAIMFIRVLFEVAILNFELLPGLVMALGGMCLMAFAIAVFVYRKKGSKISSEEKVKPRKPFTLFPALKFGGVFTIILFVAKVAQLLFGKVGLYFASFFSGLAAVDAITLSMSSLSRAGTVTTSVAVTSIVIAVISNTLVKVGIAFFAGSRKFGWAIASSFLLILATGLLILLA